MNLLLSFLAFSFSIISTNFLANEILAEPYNDDKNYCRDYNGEWNSDKEKCEFKDENSEEAYKQSICRDDDEAKHYSKIC